MKLIPVFALVCAEILGCVGPSHAQPAPVNSANLPLLCPTIVMPPAPASSAPSAQATMPQKTGITVLYVGGRLERDFRVSGRFTLPEARRNRGLFYTDWLLLIPRGHGDEPFVQINLLRWQRYHFREEIALTWELPGQPLTYADTTIFFPKDGTHELAIAMKNDQVVLEADGQTICTGDRRQFFTDAQLRTLYVQVGDEVKAPGDHLVGTVTDLLRKTDDDDAPRPFEITCEARDQGLEWINDGNGAFHGQGTFTPGLPLRETSLDPAQPCVWRTNPT
jgi:hypothetical protein